MKIIGLISLILTMGSFAIAQDKKDDFKDHKRHMLKEIDAQISELQTTKSCISSATDFESMKSCHEALEKARKHHKAEEIDERIHHLEEEKAKLDK